MTRPNINDPKQLRAAYIRVGIYEGVGQFTVAYNLYRWVFIGGCIYRWVFIGGRINGWVYTYGIYRWVYIQVGIYWWGYTGKNIGGYVVVDINRCVYTDWHIQVRIYKWVYNTGGGIYRGHIQMGINRCI